ncbi:hypothetical protein FGB62_139g124 [Gracilaria domingensis]|nr:hypothetical protein FGB62_139g124 [Gracilaria domingensis]
MHVTNGAAFPAWTGALGLVLDGIPLDIHDGVLAHGAIVLPDATAELQMIALGAAAGLADGVLEQVAGVVRHDEEGGGSKQRVRCSGRTAAAGRAAVAFIRVDGRYTRARARRAAPHARGA